MPNFIAKNPTIVMLALGFLLMIGMTLIADGIGFHVPKGYIYAAMGFSALVEGLNMLARRSEETGGCLSGGALGRANAAAPAQTPSSTRSSAGAAGSSATPSSDRLVAEIDCETLAHHAGNSPIGVEWRCIGRIIDE